MKRDLRDRWVAALRSGEYEQTMGQLLDDTGYCCLGVLCEVAGWWADHSPSQGVLMPEYSHRIGLDGLAPDSDRQTIDMGEHMANMNDAGSSFAEIADWIEEHVLVEEPDELA